MKRKNRVLLSRRKVLKAGVLAAAALVVGISPSRFVIADSSQDTHKNFNQLCFMFDQQLCIGCRSCEDACNNINKWEEGAKWRRVLQVDGSYIYLSISCNHCEKPACVEVCPVKAYTKRKNDGIVVHDSTKCVGCKYCMYACPYHAPQFSEASGRISKCHFCYERWDQGEKPACIASCPTNALSSGNLAELRNIQGGVTQPKGLPDPDLTKPSWVIIPKV